MTQCHAIFCQSLINVWKITQNRYLKQNSNESIKMRRMKGSLKWLSQIFQRKMIFYAQKVTNEFLWHFTRPKIFKISKKVHVVQPHLGIWHAKFQSDISIFDKHIEQKPYSLITAFFQTAICSISRHRTEIKMTFLESWDQTPRNTHFYSKYEFENLT